MHYRRLGRTGLSVSVLSFGGSSLGGAFRDVDEGEAIRTVHVALDHGVNFIDVSPYYGVTKAETVLGKALRTVKRDRYYLATKVGQYDHGVFDFSAARVTQSLEESCARMGVDYVDVLHCHDIEFADLDQIVNETLPALVKLRDAGRIGHIGITGLPLKIFPAVIDRVGPDVVEAILSFCHYELNDSSLASLLPYFADKDIGVINASPTGMGILTPRGAPAWHPASQAIKDGCARAVAFCQKEGVDIVKLAVQYAVHDPRIATTLIGSANPANFARNVAYAQEPIDFALMARVLELLQPIHNFNFTRGRPENRDPLLPKP